MAVHWNGGLLKVFDEGQLFVVPTQHVAEIAVAPKRKAVAPKICLF